MAAQLKDHESIGAVVQEMTLEEKAGLITGESPFHTRGIDRLGIPPLHLLDGGTGVNKMQMLMDQFYRAAVKVNNLDEAAVYRMGMHAMGLGMSVLSKLSDPGSMTPEEQQIAAITEAEMDRLKPEGGPAGCFPPGMLLGATWDPQAVYACAQALGREINACQIDMLLGTPNVNIHRDPLNGRLFEGYSEDPCLVAKLAPEFVKGIQDEGVIANAKHFAANNQETERMGINEHIPVRALHEIYFPGFKACVQEGGVRTVMSAYNSINGLPCAMNSWLLEEVLRGMWGFEGFVVSDWGAAYDQVQAAAAGNDLVMPGPRDPHCLVEAVRSGELSESVLDRCVTNYLAVLLEAPVMKGRKYTAIDSAFSRSAAYRAAAEGIVLLKNKDGALPLSKTEQVCFFGPKSKKLIESGGGSAQVWSPLSSSPFDCAVEKIGAERVSFEALAPDTSTVIITAGSMGQEGSDRPSLDLDEPDKSMLLKAIAGAKAAGKKIVVILNIAGPVSMVDWIEDVDAVLCVFIPGMEGGRAAADILFGDLNPSGKLPLTFPREYRDCPSFGNFPGEFGEVWYGEGIYVGYRYYDAKGIEPLFPFGYGLSYTTFELSDLSVQPVVKLDEGEKAAVQVKVKNTGGTAGKEVVQLYIADEEATLRKPVKELKAFQKVALEPGEEQVITLELGKEDLASFDAKLNCWTTEPGMIQVLVGTSAGDIRLSGRFKALCDNPYGYGLETGIGRLMKDARVVEVIERHTHLDPLALLGLSTVFTPDLPFAQAWAGMIAPALSGMTPQEQAALLAAICAELGRIDLTEPMPLAPAPHFELNIPE